MMWTKDGASVVILKRSLSCTHTSIVPTEGRNLLPACTVALQASEDSSTATPFRNDKNVEISAEGHTKLVESAQGLLTAKTCSPACAIKYPRTFHSGVKPQLCCAGTDWVDGMVKEKVLAAPAVASSPGFPWSAWKASISWLAVSSWPLRR